MQANNSRGVDKTELDTEKDLRYKLIQKFKKLQQRELVKEKVKLRALVNGDYFFILFLSMFAHLFKMISGFVLKR